VRYLQLLLIVLLATTLGACKDSNPASKDQISTVKPDAANSAVAEQMGAQPGMTQEKSGTVVETMDTAGYTYVKVKTADQEIWAAAPQFKVTVGDSVIIPAGMLMPNYHSNTLNRDFDELYFVSSIIAPNAEMTLNPHGDTMAAAATSGSAADHIKAATPPMDIDFSTLQKADNGYTVEEVFTNKDKLATQEVVLRAKVVKFSPNIMKTNWMHLQDGSGSEGTNDLTITTSTSAGLGDTVLVKGILDLNQDFGYGYKYDLIIQDAQVTVE